MDCSPGKLWVLCGYLLTCTKYCCRPRRSPLCTSTLQWQWPHKHGSEPESIPGGAFMDLTPFSKSRCLIRLGSRELGGYVDTLTPWGLCHVPQAINGLAVWKGAMPCCWGPLWKGVPLPHCLLNVVGHRCGRCFGLDKPQIHRSSAQTTLFGLYFIVSLVTGCNMRPLALFFLFLWKGYE